jgi:hypothetical protein
MSTLPEELAPWLLGLGALIMLALAFMLGTVWADYRRLKRIINKARKAKRTIKL